jgi:hypothetical protein
MFCRASLVESTIELPVLPASALLRFEVVELLEDEDEVPSRPLLLEDTPLVTGLTAMTRYS